MLILFIVANEDQKCIQGRTLLQKKLYFTSVLLNEDHGFIPHLYGPYSPPLADSIDSLVANGFLAELTETFLDVSNVFGERKRHTYRLTEDGVRLLDGQEAETRITDAIARVNGHTVSANFNLLSVAAKVHFILTAERQGTVDRIRRVAQDYGWNLGHDQINKVSDYLLELSLVAESS